MTPEFLAARRIVRRGQVLTVLGLLAAAAVYVIAIYFTPVEVRQGPAQKIFYVHAPAAWGALVAFGKTYRDWAVLDPAGRPLAEVRAIRDSVREHVTHLLHELSVLETPAD